MSSSATVDTFRRLLSLVPVALTVVSFPMVSFPVSLTLLSMSYWGSCGDGLLIPLGWHLWPTGWIPVNGSRLAGNMLVEVVVVIGGLWGWGGTKPVDWNLFYQWVVESPSLVFGGMLKSLMRLSFHIAWRRNWLTTSLLPNIWLEVISSLGHIWNFAAISVTTLGICGDCRMHFLAEVCQQSF